jgi:hypothetical protein
MLYRQLEPNSTDAEFGVSTNSAGIDTLSNGFKLRGSSATTNASGGTYIFLAFAEQPAKYSNAR